MKRLHHISAAPDTVRGRVSQSSSCRFLPAHWSLILAVETESTSALTPTFSWYLYSIVVSDYTLWPENWPHACYAIKSKSQPNLLEHFWTFFNNVWECCQTYWKYIGHFMWFGWDSVILFHAVKRSFFRHSSHIINFTGNQYWYMFCMRFLPISCIVNIAGIDRSQYCKSINLLYLTL